MLQYINAVSYTHLDVYKRQLYNGVHDARVFHLSLFIHIENDGECQFLFVGAEGTDEVAQPFGQHGQNY